MTQEFRPPFHINALIEKLGSLKVKLTQHLQFKCSSSPQASPTPSHPHPPKKEKKSKRKKSLISGPLLTLTNFLQAEVIIKVRAEFPSSVTANTILLEMPLPAYTSRYFYLHCHNIVWTN